MTNTNITTERNQNEVRIEKTYIYTSTGEESLVYQICNGYGDFGDAPEELLEQIIQVIDAYLNKKEEIKPAKTTNGYVVLQRIENFSSFEGLPTYEYNLLAGDFGDMHEMTREGVLELQRLINVVLQKNKES